jgi:aspartokinase
MLLCILATDDPDRRSNVPKLANTISIAGAVREEVDYDISIQDAFARGYLNVSALARILKPRIESRVGRKVNLESVITSMKRLRGKYSPSTQEIRKIVAESVVNVRTHVSKLSVERTKKALQVVSHMLATHQDDFIQVSESISSITMIFDQKLHRTVKENLGDASIQDQAEDCAAIIVHSPPSIMSTSGCITNFYNQLARRHVNIEDTVSCYTDTIMVVRMADVGRAFDALTNLITEERGRSHTR